MSQYWIKGDDGEEYGPATLEELAEWTRENRAGLDTQVRLDGSTEWKLWQFYPELTALLPPSNGESPFPAPLKLTLAPIYLRLAAYLFDLLALVFGVMFTSVAFLPPSFQETFSHWQDLWQRAHQGLPPTPAESWMIIVVMVAYVTYFTYFHGRSGQTPGKRFFRLRVVDANGLTIGYWKSFLRTIAAYLSQQLACIGHFLALVTPQRQAMHDLAAKTFVVRQPSDS
jgi:uncharacterized RDD family membrane protein YckC